MNRQTKKSVTLVHKMKQDSQISESARAATAEAESTVKRTYCFRRSQKHRQLTVNVCCVDAGDFVEPSMSTDLQNS